MDTGQNIYSSDDDDDFVFQVNTNKSIESEKHAKSFQPSTAVTNEAKAGMTNGNQTNGNQQRHNIQSEFPDASSSDEDEDDFVFQVNYTKSAHDSTSGMAFDNGSKANFDLSRPSSAVKQPQFPPIHHELNHDNLKTYIYPVDMEVRDYQRNIIRKALAKNLICALPTGLGKTFIASVVMLNWFRWTVRAKIVFIAPTRPLVAQQVESFLQISGISINETAALLSSVVSKGDRIQEWKTKRVFFATAQTIENDIRSGCVDPKDIVLLVLDEAHRATGNHSYVNVVRLIKQATVNFRLLALTATPSGHFEGVQEVISNLDIAATEIRSEESLDIRKYVHARPETRIRIDMSKDIKDLLALLAECTTEQFKILRQARITTATDVTGSHYFILRTETNKYMQSTAAMVSAGRKFQVRAVSGLMQSLSYSMHLLKIHGIYPFYVKMHQTELELLGSNGRNAKELVGSPPFKKIMHMCRELIYGEDRGPTGVYTETDRRQGFRGHPKLVELADKVYQFMRVHGADSRIIIFAEFRDSAAEIVWVLQTYMSEERPVRPNLFIGQATANKNGVKGMSQKEQQAVLTKFKNGDFNVLVATSIGEEGLDIGQVDLIICYDQSKSPIRSIQRRGRTGRKRDGEVILLLTPQEENKLSHAYGGNRYVRNVIQDNAGVVSNPDLLLQYAPANRLIPPGYEPKYTEVHITLPPENQAALASKDIIVAMRQTKNHAKPRTTKRRKKQQEALAANESLDQLGFRPASDLYNEQNEPQSSASSVPEASI